MEYCKQKPAMVGFSNTALYINSRLADYTLRIAYATSRQTRKQLEREKAEFMWKHGITADCK